MLRVGRNEFTEQNEFSIIRIDLMLCINIFLIFNVKRKKDEIERTQIPVTRPDDYFEKITICFKDPFEL